MSGQEGRAWQRMLIAKGYIGYELAEELVQRAGRIHQDHGRLQSR